VTEGLASIKVPQTLAIVEDLPKNLVGKIDKQVLRNMFPRSGSNA
jgi:non-ribosomal peptide synthetase component E (peptide arylation enzyme)